VHHFLRTQRELPGLRSGDANLDNRTFKIQHTLICINGECHAKDGTKSESSERTFKVPAEIIEALLEGQDAYALERQAAKSRWQEPGFVFGSRYGTGLYESSRRHEGLAKAAEVPRVTMHELRHTYTSLTLQRGLDIKKVSSSLGHRRSRSRSRSVHTSTRSRMKRPRSRAATYQATRPRS
jgi:integrase